MQVLRVTSLQAPNADFVCRKITEYLSARLPVPAEFVEEVPWQERERLVDAGGIHVAWMCGLYYVNRVDEHNAPIELLVAPVMRGLRYQDRPVYFSDVVVHRKSAFSTFADLRGARWAYNEPNSHSGYNVVRYHLALMGETKEYFGEVVEAGAHQTALEMIVDGRVDAAAIDSTVLEMEMGLRPRLEEKIHVIDVLGPSPIPPWVILTDVRPDLRERIRGLMLRMHEEREGEAILAQGQVKRFAKVVDLDYDPIREVARRAGTAEL
jgi:phosphonate transport system substrate-binding protein